MTLIQWLFHYKSIMKHKREEKKDQVELTKTALEVLLSKMDSNTEFLGLFIDSSKFRAYQKKKEEMQAKEGYENLSEEQKEFFDLFDEIEAEFPEELLVEISKKDGEESIKKIDRRSLGIQKR